MTYGPYEVLRQAGWDVRVWRPSDLPEIVKDLAR